MTNQVQNPIEIAAVPPVHVLHSVRLRHHILQLDHRHRDQFLRLLQALYGGLPKEHQPEKEFKVAS